MRALAPLLVFTLITAPGARAQDDSLPPPATIAELQSRIRDVLAETRTPAIGIALVSRDSLLWVAGLGTADVAAGRAATETTLFRIGSTSKAFVSLVVLQLEQEGRLRLEDPIWAHAPEIAYENRWEQTDPVRIVHLLEHATGWDDLALRDYALNDSTITLRQGLDYNPGTRTSRWRPGTRVAYCNSGPAVAAYIAEKLEGRPFEDVVRERLFAPLGMTTATYLRPDPPERLATLYGGDGTTPQFYWHILQRPAGAINASARDMAQYVRFLLNRGRVGGRQLLPAAAIERMERPRRSLTARSGLALGYGLHLATYVDSGWVWVGHDGGVNGGLTNMAYRPDQGVGFAFMINSGNVDAYERIGRLVRDYLTRDAAAPEPPAPIAMPALARERTGWYRPDNPRVQGLYFLQRVLGLGRVTVDDSTLVARPLVGKPTRYSPVAERLFRTATDPVPTLALVDDPDNGRAEAIEVMGYLVPTSYHRVWAPVVWLELIVAGLFLLCGLLSLAFALIWVPRWLVRRLRNVPQLHVRVWPLLATLAVVVFVATLAVSVDDAFVRFGTRTPWAWTLFTCTLAFPVASLLGLVAAVRPRHPDARRGVRWLALVTSAVYVVVAAYLGWWGVIGWRSWG
ncbi:MAG: beta-lactamase family protein [Gemmatimonadota bacterium]|nr:beta-lactamase family protein [Gemmatimonadota bacterium]